MAPWFNVNFMQGKAVGKVSRRYRHIDRCGQPSDSTHRHGWCFLCRGTSVDSLLIDDLSYLASIILSGLFRIPSRSIFLCISSCRYPCDFLPHGMMILHVAVPLNLTSSPFLHLLGFIRWKLIENRVSLYVCCQSNLSFTTIWLIK